MLKGSLWTSVRVFKNGIGGTVCRSKSIGRKRLKERLIRSKAGLRGWRRRLGAWAQRIRGICSRCVEGERGSARLEFRGGRFGALERVLVSIPLFIITLLFPQNAKPPSVMENYRPCNPPSQPPTPAPNTAHPAVPHTPKSSFQNYHSYSHSVLAERRSTTHICRLLLQNRRT